MACRCNGGEKVEELAVRRRRTISVALYPGWALRAIWAILWSCFRFEEESDAVIRASDAECLLNPTPMMIHQMAKIRQRALDNNTASPAKGFKAFRKRNRSLSFSRSSLAAASTSRARKSMTPTPSKTPVKK